MRHLAFVLTLALPGLASASNLDFSKGTLSSWEGRGFYLTTANSRGPSVHLGVCSSDGGNRTRRGELRCTFEVPPRAQQLRFTAFVVRRKGASADDCLDVLLLHGPSQLPRLVKKEQSWELAPRLLPRAKGEAREYCWDVSGHVGKTLEVLLLDEDPRPGCYLFCSGFQMHAAQTGAESLAQFASDMRQLAERQQLAPVSRYQSSHFVAWSNAGDDFTVGRMRNCDLLYRLFFDHFRNRGFQLQRPTGKLMVAVFDGQRGFEAYLGQALPAAITGLYDRRSNRLVLYDVNGNDAIAASKQKALDASKKIKLDMERLRVVGAMERQLRDLSLDASVATAIHETAHHLSFNTGMLNRFGDAPLWVVEGLACYCEATSQGDWQGIGALNLSRLNRLAEMEKVTGQFLPLQTLIGRDDWRNSSKSALAGYSQSWALFRQLMEEKAAEMRRYLALIYDRRDPGMRLDDFQKAFGEVGRAEARHRQYVRELVQRQGRK